MRLSRALLLALMLSCAPVPAIAPLPAGGIDCGSFDAGHDTYDPAGIDCFWRAYNAGTPVRWAVKQLTVEGDSVPQTIEFVPGRDTTVTRDMTADNSSSSKDRRVWTYRCAAIARVPWATDPARSFLALSGCSGDGATTAFP